MLDGLRGFIEAASSTSASIILCAILFAAVGGMTRWCRRKWGATTDGAVFNANYIYIDLAHGFTMFPFLLILGSSLWSDLFPKIMQGNKLTILFGALVGVLHALSGILRPKVDPVPNGN